MEIFLYKTVKLLVGGVFSNFLASSYLIHHDERLPGDLEASRPRFFIHPFSLQENITYHFGVHQFWRDLNLNVYSVYMTKSHRI